MRTYSPLDARALTIPLVLFLLLVFVPAPGYTASSSAIQKELDSVASAYGKLETQLAHTTTKQKNLEREQQETERIVAQKSAALRTRAGSLYKKGGSGMWTELLTSPNFGVFVRRLQYLERLGDGDRELVEKLRVAEGKAATIRTDLAATKSNQSKIAEDLKSRRQSLEKKLAEANKAEEAKRRQAAAKLKAVGTASTPQRRQLEAASKGVTLAEKPRGRVGSFALPIAGPSAFTDTWGDPRSGGRRHQGTDVMAPCGAQVVAVTDGVISRVMNSGNGGKMAYLRAGNGDQFTYAHLQSYAPGTAAGRQVSAGDLIAYNGNSGNASGGPCHVHFEYAPGGGSPVNPYPLLASAR